MLLNLSNHPAARWPETQKQAAIAEFGEVEDLPFPQIDPNAGPTDIARLAEQYAQICVDKLAASKRPPLTEDAVHIMGEMTFTVAVVRLLKDKNIRCVASATERVVTQETDSQKTSLFKFRQFRDYTANR